MNEMCYIHPMKLLSAIKGNDCRAGRIAQWLGHAALAEDPSSVPNTHLNGLPPSITTAPEDLTSSSGLCG